MNFYQTYKPFYRRNLTVAFPIMLTQAGQMLVQLADNIMVGHLGTKELAGVSFANSIFIIGIVFCTGFSQGSTPHIGQAYGKGNFRQAGTFFQNSLLIDFIASIAVTAALAGVGFLMPMMGQDPEVLGFAKEYYNIMLWTIVPGIMFFGIRQFSEGIGITKYAMYLTLSANVLNIFLNWVLIYGKLGMPAMGVSGAAISTLISRIMMLAGFITLLLTVYPYRHYLKYFSKTAFHAKQIRQLLSTSFPLSIQSLTEICAFSLSTIMVGWLGATTLAGHQVAQSLSTLSFMIAIGIGAATTIRVSHQYGGGHYKDAKMAATASMHLSMLLMGTAGLLFVIFRNYIPFIYTTDKEVVSITANILILVAIYQIFDALQLSSLASLRALADVKVPMIMSFISYFLVCLPLGYVFGFVLDFGVYGVWTGLMLGLFFAAVLYNTRFRILINRIIKKEQGRAGENRIHADSI